MSPRSDGAPARERDGSRVLLPVLTTRVWVSSVAVLAVLALIAGMLTVVGPARASWPSLDAPTADARFIDGVPIAEAPPYTDVWLDLDLVAVQLDLLAASDASGSTAPSDDEAPAADTADAPAATDDADAPLTGSDGDVVVRDGGGSSQPVDRERLSERDRALLDAIEGGGIAPLPPAVDGADPGEGAEPADGAGAGGSDPGSDDPSAAPDPARDAPVDADAEGAADHLDASSVAVWLTEATGEDVRVEHVTGVRYLVIGATPEQLTDLDGVVEAREAAMAQLSAGGSFDQQWALNNTGQVAGWDEGTPGIDIDWLDGAEVPDGSGITVAIVDAAFSRTHANLQTTSWWAPDGGGTCFGEADLLPCQGLNLVEDAPRGTVFIEDLVLPPPADATETAPTNPVGWSAAHATHLAGVIAGSPSGDAGIVGVAPGVTLLPMVVTPAPNNSFPLSRVVTAINEAIDAGADVINLSLSTPPGRGADEDLSAALVRAAQQRVVVVAAAGNSGTDLDARPAYPASAARDAGATTTLAVAAMDNRGRVPAFSNRGLETVDLGAPGVGVLGPVPPTDGTPWDWADGSGGWALASGTSVAAAHVSGVVARMLLVQGELPLEPMIDRIVGAGVATEGLRPHTRMGTRVSLGTALGLRSVIFTDLRTREVQPRERVDVETTVLIPDSFGDSFDLTLLLRSGGQTYVSVDHELSYTVHPAPAGQPAEEIASSFDGQGLLRIDLQGTEQRQVELFTQLPAGDYAWMIAEHRSDDVVPQLSAGPFTIKLPEPEEPPEAEAPEPPPNDDPPPDDTAPVEPPPAGGGPTDDGPPVDDSLPEAPITDDGLEGVEVPGSVAVPEPAPPGEDAPQSAPDEGGSDEGQQDDDTDEPDEVEVIPDDVEGAAVVPSSGRIGEQVVVKVQPRWGAPDQVLFGTRSARILGTAGIGVVVVVPGDTEGPTVGTTVDVRVRVPNRASDDGPIWVEYPRAFTYLDSAMRPPGDQVIGPDPETETTEEEEDNGEEGGGVTAPQPDPEPGRPPMFEGDREELDDGMAGIRIGAGHPAAALADDTWPPRCQVQCAALPLVREPDD